MVPPAQGLEVVFVVVVAALDVVHLVGSVAAQPSLAVTGLASVAVAPEYAHSAELPIVGKLGLAAARLPSHGLPSSGTTKPP
jgi:hypothetical protein